MDTELKTKIENQIKADRIIVYMKGDANMPRCGFSAAVVETFKKHGKPFKTYDILEDADLRQGLKEFTNWPTFPQVYIDGKFVGGCDIVMDMDKNGELKSLL